MATSGTLQLNPNTYTTDGSPNRADISWGATWNQSTLQWTVSWQAVAAGNTRSYWVTIFSGTVTFKDANGNVLQTKSMAGQIPKAYGGTVLISDSFSCGVDSLGNQTLNISGTFQIEYNGSGSNNAGTSQGSGSFALDQKPLASTISSVTSNVGVTSSGGTCSVSISRNSSSYTHTVVYSFGSNSATHTSVGTSDSYTIPASWLSAIPNSATGTGTVTVTTYYSGTQIGSATSANFTVTANVYPSVGTFTVAPRGTAYNAGITSVYIAGYSTALLSASSVAGVNGSSIYAYEFIKDGSVVATYYTSATSYSYTTGNLSGSSATFSVRVTDSRGRQTTKAANAITIQAYATPSFSNTSVYRSNSGGTADTSGTYCYIKTTASATPAANSITALTYATKLTTASSYGGESNLASGTASIPSGFANTSSYNIRITATDKLGNKSYYYATIPTAEYTMDFRVGGKGVAFGKVAETDNLVESAWALKSAGTIEAGEHIVVSGTTRRNPNLRFKGKGDSAYAGAVLMEYGTNTPNSFTSMVMNFEVPALNSGGALNGHYEYYGLPASTTNLSGDTQYQIMTNKAATVDLDTSITGLRAKKWGLIVNLEFKTAYTTNSTGNVGTLPSGYRPAAEFYGTLFLGVNGTYYPALLHILTSGAMDIYYFNGSSYVRPPQGADIYGTITFIQR